MELPRVFTQKRTPRLRSTLRWPGRPVRAAADPALSENRRRTLDTDACQRLHRPVKPASVTVWKSVTAIYLTQKS